MPSCSDEIHASVPLSLDQPPSRTLFGISASGLWLVQVLIPATSHFQSSRCIALLQRWWVTVLLCPSGLIFRVWILVGLLCLPQCTLDPEIVHVRAYPLIHVGVTSSFESFVSKTGPSWGAGQVEVKYIKPLA